MLDERSISARCLVTTGLWLASLGSWLVSWLLGLSDLGRLSLIVCGIAVTVTVKGFFIEHQRMMKTALMVRSTVDSVRTLR